MRQSRPPSLLLRAYVLALLAVEGGLVTLHFVFPEWRFVNLDREHNLPTWFSGVQLAAIAVASLAAFHREPGTRPTRWVWAVLAAGFLYLSFDEITVVHEGVLRQETRDALGAASLLRTLPPWQLLFAPIAALAAITFGFVFASRFVVRRNCWLPGTAGVALWGISFVFEGTATRFFIPSGWYQVEVALEESCEMVGAALLLLAIGNYAIAAPREDTPEIGRPLRAVAWALPAIIFLALPAVTVGVLMLHGREGINQMSGERLLDAGDYGKAIDAFAASLAANPDDLDSLRGLGTAAYRSGDLDLAQEMFRRAVSLAPEDKALPNALDLIRLKKRLAAQ